MMKKIFCVVLVLLLLLILASCDRVKIELQEPEEPVPEDVSELVPVESDDVSEKELSPEKEEIPEGYRKVEFEGCSVLIGDNFYQSGTLVEEILPFENQLMGDDGETIRVIAEFLSAEDVADPATPFAATDEKYAASINTVELSLGGFAAKKYRIKTQVGGPLSAFDNTIFYCIDLDGKMVTFAYYPVMGFGGLHTEDMEAILDTIWIS